MSVERLTPFEAVVALFVIVAAMIGMCSAFYNPCACESMSGTCDTPLTVVER